MQPVPLSLQIERHRLPTSCVQHDEGCSPRCSAPASPQVRHGPAATIHYFGFDEARAIMRHFRLATRAPRQYRVTG